MGLSEAPPSQPEILEAGLALGRQMDVAIPFRRGGLARLIGAFQYSERIILPVVGDEGTFMRAWLERRAAREEYKSPIELLTDTVTVIPSRTNYADQTGTGFKVVAVYYPHTRLELGEDPEMPHENYLARIGVLSSYVTDIYRAELYRQLKAAVPERR